MMVTAPAFWVFAAVILVGALWGLWITIERCFSRGPSLSRSSSSDRKKEQQQQQQQQAKGKQRQQLIGEESRHVQRQQQNEVPGGGGGGGAGYYDEERNVGVEMQRPQRGGLMGEPRVAAR